MSNPLLSPLQVGSVTLPNRIIMGSMHLGFEGAADAGARMAAFYAERAAGGAALIVTGGQPPNAEGDFGPCPVLLTDAGALDAHRQVAEAVHAAGGRILLQILHTGRYGLHPDIVAPSALRAPINRFVPREMNEADIERTIEDFVRTAELARQAGYDGVEVMASEGYLINQFLAPRTNRREDGWGGSAANRRRFAEAIVRGIRALSADLLLMVRLSMVDLVEDGSTAEEVVALARALEACGADILNTGIGWHESRVPTIAHSVPAGAWRWATSRVKAAVGIPVAASNRINTATLAEEIVAAGEADLVSMARPLLADPRFAAKLRAGRAETINTCIGCNQGCLDLIFSAREATCLVNPAAGRELSWKPRPAGRAKRLAVVGGGPAGLACAAEAAERGHRVTLFEAAPELGGQLRLAREVPGKGDYAATPGYFAARLAAAGAEIRLGRAAGAADLAGFDEVVLASGIAPRRLELPGADHPMVVGYEDLLSGRRAGGQRVAIIGSGPIGFDVAAYLLAGQEPADPAAMLAGFFADWGVDPEFRRPGGLIEPRPATTSRRLVMLQRSAGKAGEQLGKTTGWILKALLHRHRVEMLSGVVYRRIDDAGLHVLIDGAPRLIEADTVVVCAGQEARRDLAAALAATGLAVRVIGGARDATRLDALKAIEEGARLGLEI